MRNTGKAYTAIAVEVRRKEHTAGNLESEGENVLGRHMAVRKE